MDQSLQERLLARVEQNPEARAIAYYNGRGEFSWLTREAFHAGATRSAAHLAGHGLERGDVCVLVLHSGAFAAAMVAAVLHLGAVPLLVAPPVLQGRQTYSSLTDILKGIIGKTRPRLVVCAAAMTPVRGELEATFDTTRFLLGEAEVHSAPPATPTPATPDPTDVAGMQLTSGTTGFPRICVWKQARVLAALDGMKAAMKLRAEDVCLNWTPLYHDMGLVNNFLLCLSEGIPLVMLNPLHFVNRPALWLRALSDTGATLTWSPNFGFAITAQRVRDDQIEGVRLDGVRAFWNAAERIHLETIHAFHERFAPFGVRYEALKTNFGCAENVGGATFSDPDAGFVFERVDRALLQDQGIARPVEGTSEDVPTMTVVGVGKPCPRMHVRILAEDGADLPEGHVGEVALDTPSRMEGYLGDEEATRRALDGELLRTGDLGYVRDGELFWTGRVRERLTVRGKKLDPSEFEAPLLQVDGLRPGCFAVFGVDNEAAGTQRVVVVTEVRDASHHTYGEVEREIRRRVLLQVGVPVDEVVLVPTGTLAKTSSGKRRHRFFRQLYLDGRLDARLPLNAGEHPV